MDERKVVFVTGTRADYGKLAPLARVSGDHVSWFVTGMHLERSYGLTIREIEREWGSDRVWPHYNHTERGEMDHAVAETIDGLGAHVRHHEPHLLIVHGDRPEALAGAIVGAMTNTLTVHVEGGEKSGGVDEGVRHAITKLAHVHLVANDAAAELVQRLGEHPQHIHTIGSPEVDGMENLPPLSAVQERYEIPWDRYGVLIWHPHTTEGAAFTQAREVVNACAQVALPWVVIDPNSDTGSDAVKMLYERRMFQGDGRWRLLPSLRFGHFQALIKHARVIVGNSSAGIREAPCHGTPTVNVGTRQQGRDAAPSVIDAVCEAGAITAAIVHALETPTEPRHMYGTGHAGDRFRELLSSEAFWETSKQKVMM